MPDVWNPSQYELFKAERDRPFFDLLEGLKPATLGRALDLGCGTGELTLAMAQWSAAAEVVGVDSSSAMLREARRRGRSGVSFVEADMTVFAPERPVDVIVANASLQWVPNHADVLSRWLSFLNAGGQLAVQVPANADHASHLVAKAVAQEPGFAELWGADGPPGDPVSANVLPPERYAELLYGFGLVDIRVQLNVYPHVLPSTDALVEWVKGTTLNRFRARLSSADFDRFLEVYRARLVERLGARTPFFYPFKRILFWGRRP